MEPLMNKKMTLMKKIIILFIMLFSFFKILIFPQRLFDLFKIIARESNGKYISPYDKQSAFNIWISFTALIESLLFAVLFYYMVLILRGENKRKEIIRLCLAIVVFFYPVELFLNYLILGKNSLMGVIPFSFTAIFLLFFAAYFWLCCKD